jgi:hypothetical protein
MGKTTIRIKPVCIVSEIGVSRVRLIIDNGTQFMFWLVVVLSDGELLLATVDGRRDFRRAGRRQPHDHGAASVRMPSSMTGVAETNPLHTV